MSAELLHLDEPAAYLELLSTLESLPETLLNYLQGSFPRLVYNTVYYCQHCLYGAREEADGRRF